MLIRANAQREIDAGQPKSDVQPPSEFDVLVTYLLLLQKSGQGYKDGMSLWKIAHPDLVLRRLEHELISMSANDILAAVIAGFIIRFKCLLQVELGDDDTINGYQRFLDTITKGSSGRKAILEDAFETIAEYPVEIIPQREDIIRHINQIGDVFTLSMTMKQLNTLGQDDIKPIPSDMRSSKQWGGLMTALFFFDFGATSLNPCRSRCS
ncbi:hypothetical protein SPFM15_00018 [Salmonella phage SPFM15]|nr:hypothetical protein SPFM5_00013 [Salmonella phage SPFM5]VFR13346.1 hypothetical protein SPFM14_00011 [Salmonella phage SPFM14]VFR13642.1 hypothetical protein SPFM15_00018 [Salmonella phage SPFM15]